MFRIIPKEKVMWLTWRREISRKWFAGTSDESAPDNKITLSSGSLCTDINCERVNYDLHLLHTLTSVLTKSGSDSNDTASDLTRTSKILLMSPTKRTDTEPQHPSHPGKHRIIFDMTSQNLQLHRIRGKIFNISPPHFPTLFPTGLGGHLDERAVKASLEDFRKWALSHHSRRWV